LNYLSLREDVSDLNFDSGTFTVCCDSTTRRTVEVSIDSTALREALPVLLAATWGWDDNDSLTPAWQLSSSHLSEDLDGLSAEVSALRFARDGSGYAPVNTAR
jgi:hypothetical protein